MLDPLSSSSNLTPLSGAQALSGAERKEGVQGDGAMAFKALLDQLEQRANALELESKKDLSKDDLAGAIDNARASLEQMLSLKDRLLEAWRASQQQDGPPSIR